MQTEKHPWDPAEDELLSKLVKIHGIKSWTLVSQSFVNRTGKHCRERWFNHLNPDIKKGDWTPDDDFIIIAMQKELGNQWAKMTKCLPGRTDNAVKNRFYAVQRANKKLAEAKLQASQLEASKEAGQASDATNKNASGLSLLCEVVFAQAVVTSMFPSSSNLIATCLKRRLSDDESKVNDVKRIATSSDRSESPSSSAYLSSSDDSKDTASESTTTIRKTVSSDPLSTTTQDIKSEVSH